MSNVSVLFVCLGNICRSPMAEGLFAHLVEAEGLSDHIQVDSCGTSGWHIGEPPDSRMQETALTHGVRLGSRARQLKAEDFLTFDYILPMDHNNYRNVMAMREQVDGAKAQVYLMRYFDEQAPEADVPDPYYGGQKGFEDVYQMLERSCQKLLAHIREEHQL